MRQKLELKKKRTTSITREREPGVINPFSEPQTEKEIEELSEDFARIEQALDRAQESGIISPSREAAERFVEVEFNQTVGE